MKLHTVTKGTNGRGEEKKRGGWEYMLKVPYILKCLIKQSTTCNECMTAKILRNKKEKWSRARTKGAVCYLAASPRSYLFSCSSDSLQHRSVIYRIRNFRGKGCTVIKHHM